MKPKESVKLLYNLTQHQILYPIVSARSITEKMIGLLGKSQKTGIYFQTRWGIHTIGMAYPLTVLVCNDNFCVQTIHPQLLPNQFYFWNLQYKHIFELPYNQYPVTIGDTLQIQTPKSKNQTI